MSLRINQNLEAMIGHRHLSRSSNHLAKSMERLSSGLRINRASDDAAGLALSERMRSTINGLAQAQRNAQDGISLVQTAEGSLQEVTNILQRIRDLAVQFNNGVYGSAEKQSLAAEVAELSLELDRIVASAEFAGYPLLDGTTPDIILQAGPNSGDTITITGVDVAPSLGAEIATFAGYATTAGLTTTVDIDAIQAAIDNVSAIRGQFGAVGNRLEYTINSLGAYQENLQAAESRIRDVDMASEMVEFTRLQILQQTGIAMIGQANMNKQSLLSLLMN